MWNVECGMWSEITPSFEKQVHNAQKGLQQPAQGQRLGGEIREQANALQGQLKCKAKGYG